MNSKSPNVYHNSINTHPSNIPSISLSNVNIDNRYDFHTSYIDLLNFFTKYLEKKHNNKVLDPILIVDIIKMLEIAFLNTPEYNRKLLINNYYDIFNINK